MRHAQDRRPVRTSGSHRRGHLATGAPPWSGRRLGANRGSGGRSRDCLATPHVATQDSLLVFCFELVLERAIDRIATAPIDEDARRRAEQVLLEILPLDSERQGEMQVWLAFTAASMATPHLASIYARGHDALQQLCQAVLYPLVDDSELEIESARMHALIDGLAMHLIARTDRGAADLARTIVARHLDSLASPAVTAGSLVGDR